ncbi:MAG: oligosaccharide flippase family protein [Anaerolineae bacterium]|nr:oligosaccharide flippase family protein [Anaerolineae bacterium]
MNSRPDRSLWAGAAQVLTGRTTKARLIRGTGGTFVLRLGNMALKFAISLALARLLGAGHYGVFNFAQAWILLLIIPATAGFDRLLIRDLSTYLMEGAWPAMRGLLRFATRWALILSAGLIALGLAAAWLTYTLTGRPALLNAEQAGLARAALVTLAVALLVLPPRALTLIQQSAMQGLRHVVLGQVPDQVLQPALFLAALGITVLVGRAVASAQAAMALFVVTTLLALAFSMWRLREALPSAVRAATPVSEGRAWLTSAVPFALTQGLIVLNVQVDSLMLGALDSAEAVAYYTVTQRLTTLITLPLISVGVALAPHIASLHAAGQRRELQRAVTGSTRLALGTALPITLLYIVAGTFFLGLFGAEYRVAQTALALFSLGQLVNAATGPVGPLLLMTGHERAATLTTGLGVALHIVLNALLIPLWSIEGAAAAGGISIAAVNLTLAALAWRRLRINTLPVGE